MQLFIYLAFLLILISPSTKAQDANQINEADKLYEAYNKAKSKFDSFNNNKKTWLYSKVTQTANDEYSSFKSNSKYHPLICFQSKIRKMLASSTSMLR